MWPETVEQDVEMGVGDRDGVGVGVGISAVGRESPCATNPMSAVFSASMWICGCVVWVGGVWWMVDGGWDGSSRPVCHP